MSIPKGWADAALADVADINPANPDTMPSDETLVSFVPMALVEELSGRLDPGTHRTWRDVKKGYSKFQEGDVVVAKITPSMENGKAAVARGLSNAIGAGTTELHVLRPRHGIEAGYLLHYILQECFRRNARGRMTGTAGQLRVPSAFLQEQRIPLPPLAEQARIVESVDSFLSRLDAAIASLEAAQRKLKAYRASVLKAAVEGRLVPTEAELARKEGRSYEPAKVLLQKILKERRRRWEEAELAKMKVTGKAAPDDRWKAKYSLPERPDTAALPQLPKGWCWITMSQISVDRRSAISAGPFGTIFKAKDFRPTGVPIIQLRHVKPDRFLSDRQTYMEQGTWEELFREDYSVFGGELLITKLGDPPGDCAVFPANKAPSMLTPDVIKLEVDERLAVPRYVMHYVNSLPAKLHAWGAAFGTTRLRLTLPLFRAMPLALPPLAEQQRIVDIVDSLLSIGGELEANCVRESRRVARLTGAILAHAFEGKLVDQDPSDKPADELLARIRAERAATVRATPKQRRASKPRAAL